MIVGVMSDSHDNIVNVEKAFRVFKEHGVETIIHLGDIISPFIVRKMAALSWSGLNVYAVYGNNDGDKVLLLRLFKEKGWVIDNGPMIIDIDGRRILVMHGVDGIELTRRLALGLAESLDVDAVLYGHTHKRDLRRIGSKLVLNPGETYGLLYGEATIALLDTKSLDATFIELK